MFSILCLYSCQKEISCEGCVDGNKPPIAIAGPDQVISLPTDSVSLDGSASSDPDGTINQWQWTKISGPTQLNLSTTSLPQIKAKSLVTGDYVFELKVTDDKGLTAKDTVQVTVVSTTPSNRPPVARAGNDTIIILPTNTVSLNGGASSDPDNNITSYAWRKIAGPASFNIINPSAVQTQVADLVVGVYLYELKVTDAGSLFSNDTIQVIVVSSTQNNSPPVARAGNDTTIILPTNTVSLNGGASSDPDNNITSYAWRKIAGPTSFNIINANAVQTQVANLVVGVYQFELKVTDAGSLFSNDTIQVTVVSSTPANRPPVARAGNDMNIILPINTVNLDGSASTDPDNNITSYTWTKVAGPATFNIIDANDVQTQVTSLAAGVYQFELKVTDALGLFSRDTVSVSVNPFDPTGCNMQPDWEIIITLPIDSAYIDDYFRDTEGTCVGFVCGPGGYSISGGWVKNLVPGIYYFRRYWYSCITAAELIKVTVVNDPSEPNTITFKNMLWEYNLGLNPNGPPHLYLTRPAWPGTVNPPIEVYLQMTWLNNGAWFQIPSNTGGINIWYDWQTYGWTPLTFFIVRITPDDPAWNGRRANLKIKIL